MKTALPHRREAYRLWFEYLRVARTSSLASVQAALRQSSLFYAPWGDVTNVTFNTWWKEKGQLFEDKFVVRKLTSGEQPSDPNALIIEIPLSRSPTVLIKNVKALIQDAVAVRAQASKKSKKVPTSAYRLTEGAEPKLLAVREMLTVYRDVYLKNPNLRGYPLLKKIHAFYQGRKNKRWAKVPMPLLPDPYGDTVRAQRNMRRYIDKAERVMLNVANGQFPGEY
jgi:hypothetical protein